MKIEVSAGTDVGRRRAHNEDAFVVDADAGVFVVCDGMGGHASGEVASRMASEALHRALLEHLDAIRDGLVGDAGEPRIACETMRACIEAANREVRELSEASDAHRGMGTTLTAIVIAGERAVVGHVGDSRLYLRRGDSVHQITTDHTILTEMIRAGRVAPEDAEKVGHLNALTRAVGVYPSVEVDVLEMDVLPEDVFLLCSDGLHGYFEGFALDTFLEHAAAESAASDLIDFANKRGGADNITAVALFVRDGLETDASRELRLTLDVLREIPLFHYLTFAELLKVVTVCRPVTVVAGQEVIEEGTRGDDFFLVLEGELKVHRGSVEMAQLGSGQHFGEMSLIDNRPRSASVTALTNGRLIRITRDDFYEVMRQDSVMAVKLLWNFIQTLSALVRTRNNELNPVASQSRPDGFAHPYRREDHDA